MLIKKISLIFLALSSSLISMNASAVNPITPLLQATAAVPFGFATKYLAFKTGELTAKLLDHAEKLEQRSLGYGDDDEVEYKNSYTRDLIVTMIGLELAILQWMGAFYAAKSYLGIGDTPNLDALLKGNQMVAANLPAARQEQLFTDAHQVGLDGVHLYFTLMALKTALHDVHQNFQSKSVSGQSQLLGQAVPLASAGIAGFTTAAFAFGLTEAIAKKVTNTRTSAVMVIYLAIAIMDVVKGYYFEFAQKVPTLKDCKACKSVYEFAENLPYVIGGVIPGLIKLAQDLRTVKVKTA